MGMGNIATTGMQAAMTNMDVISNDIANANTLGFKESSATFSDIFPSGSNAGGAQVGLGVALRSIQQNFKPGGIQDTGILSDLCITGNGFFIMKDATGGQTTYTRNGHFGFDTSTGYFTVGNSRLQGFAAVNGDIPAGSTATDLKINTAPQAAKASTTVTANGINLNSGDPAHTGTFSATDPTTYNYKNNTTIYDSLGNATSLDLYYVKTASNTWSVYAAVNNTVINPSSPGTLSFTNAGALSSATGLTGLGYTPTTGAAAMSFDVIMTSATQYGNASGVVAPFKTDGYPAGTFTTYEISNDGKVKAKYTNGPDVLVGQVAIATFQSPQNLQNLGGSSWSATEESGEPVINTSNSINNVRQGQLERSNVDLATALVNLISAQNVFQANAQVEQTYNQVMQTVTKL